MLKNHGVTLQTISDTDPDGSFIQDPNPLEQIFWIRFRQKGGSALNSSLDFDLLLTRGDSSAKDCKSWLETLPPANIWENNPEKSFFSLNSPKDNKTLIHSMLIIKSYKRDLTFDSNSAILFKCCLISVSCFLIILSFSANKSAILEAFCGSCCGGEADPQ
uniref:Uncharacterized protein n=1 Tax=Romanomermis culicivorax TaxID=13658 RepID=A0A915IF56_ROMCU